MMDWTDRHCRFFHRLITQKALLYTEMVTTGALLHGDVPRHLRYHEQEHPVALQLGGSEPADLAACAKLGESWGYDEINLNCGCPSERVQRGSFGACLMNEAALVADGVKAMQDAVRKGVAERLTVDHSYVAEQVKLGLMTPEEAEVSHMQSLITRAIGAEPDVVPDLFQVILQAGDTVLLTSDGLTRHVTDEEIGEMLSPKDGVSVEQACEGLVEAAKAAGGTDNITCVVLRFG